MSAIQHIRDFASLCRHHELDPEATFRPAVYASMASALETVLSLVDEYGFDAALATVPAMLRSAEEDARRLQNSAEAQDILTGCIAGLRFVLRSCDSMSSALAA